MKNLIDKIYKKMEHWHECQPRKDKGHIGAYCLWWAYFTVEVLQKEDINAQIQAGTAYWPILTEEQDDGVSPNQFGYLFEYNKNAIFKIIQGHLPEMHVWAAVAKENTIIDVTTKFWPERCMQMISRRWLAPKPPDYLWAKISEIPNGVTYQADVRAIQLAYQILSLTS